MTIALLISNTTGGGWFTKYLLNKSLVCKRASILLLTNCVVATLVELSLISSVALK